MGLREPASGEAGLDLDALLGFEPEPDFVYPPRRHQEAEWAYRDHPSRVLLWHMRTGKTKAAIDKACHLARKGEVDGVLVLAPNGVHRNWARLELPKHHWRSVPYRRLEWNTTTSVRRKPGEPGRLRGREKRVAEQWQAEFDRALKDPMLTWLCVNSEAVGKDNVKREVARFVRSRKRLMLVIDELDDYRTPGSHRTKAARALAKVSRYRLGMTGTVVANSPLHAFAQFECIEPGALGFTRFEDFKRRYAVEELQRLKSGRQFPAIVGYQNEEELRERMARLSSVVTRESADMPPLVQHRVYFDLAPEQVRAYRQLHAEYRMLHREEEVISFVEGGARLLKLQQVLSGFIIGEDLEVRDLCPDGNPRLEALSLEASLLGPIVVWCLFREDIRRVAARLRRDGRRVCEYHGGVSNEDREDAKLGLQSGRYDALVGQPAAGGRGLDFSAARDILWYSHTPNLIHRQQADERCTTVGGGSVGVVDFAAADTADEYILDEILAPKVSLADRIAGRGMAELLAKTEI